jgi:hypothetical protein
MIPVGVLFVVGTAVRMLAGVGWTEAMIFGLLAAVLCWATVDEWRDSVVGLFGLWRDRGHK